MVFFGGAADENDGPTPAHVGKFLKTADLLVWHESMQHKYPTVFTSYDKLFGDDGAQHKKGTKLMAYMGNNPIRSVRVEVLGSKWTRMIDYDDMVPVYIVRVKGQDGLMEIPLSSAHEDRGWQLGWNVMPPPPFPRKR